MWFAETSKGPKSRERSEQIPAKNLASETPHYMVSVPTTGQTKYKA